MHEVRSLISECRSAGSLIRTEVARLTIYLGASNDITNIHSGLMSRSCDSPGGQMRH
jgi:hypothetical protein